MERMFLCLSSATIFSLAPSDAIASTSNQASKLERKIYTSNNKYKEYYYYYIPFRFWLRNLPKIFHTKTFAGLELVLRRTHQAEVQFLQH
jgi:hypothetical protein